MTSNRRRDLSGLGVALLGALILVACGSGESREGATARPSPSDPVARFNELIQIGKSGSFRVTYDLQTDYHDEQAQFAWLQNARLIRWDQANVTDTGIGAESDIDDGQGNLISCLWASDKSDGLVDAICFRGSFGDDVRKRALDGYAWLPQTIQYVESKVILETEAECFRADTFDVTGTICLSETGAPLEVHSTVSVGRKSYKFSLTAIEIAAAPSDREITTPVISNAATQTGDSVENRVLPEALTLPRLPVVTNYFASSK